nr:hypothetical protein [Tanacetum cinerariifolium]
MWEKVRTCTNQKALLNALIAEMEAFDNPGEVFNTLIGLKDDVRVEDAKLIGLNDLIVEAEEEIEMKEAQLEDKMRYVFSRSYGEDESMARLMRDLCFSLRVSLSNKQRLVAELEAIREVEGVVKYLEHMRAVVSRDVVTLGELETLLGRAQLAEVANSSCLQDKMKVVFVQARGADESFIALMRDFFFSLKVSIAKNRRLIDELDALGQPAEASKPLDYMKEMVVCDFAMLRDLEQLLAGTHVRMRLKASYIAAMEEIE